MSDLVPQLDIGLSEAGQPVVIVGEAAEEAHDMAALLRLAPGVALPAHASDAAVLANHLAHGVQYAVITDPARFETGYKARLASEDPNAPWQENVRRLHDFGVPDFATIKRPRFEGGQLVFFATDTYLGVPYRVQLAELAAAPSYTPVPLSPLPAPTGPTPPAAVPEPPEISPNEPEPVRPVTPKDLEDRRTNKPGDLPKPQ